MNNKEMKDLEITQYDEIRHITAPISDNLRGSIFENVDFSHVDSMFSRQKGFALMA